MTMGSALSTPGQPTQPLLECTELMLSVLSKIAMPSGFEGGIGDVP